LIDFDKLSVAYILGELDIAGLEDAIDKVPPARREITLTLLESLHKQRRVPDEFYPVMKRRLLREHGDDSDERNNAISGVAYSGDGGDAATVVRPRTEPNNFAESLLRDSSPSGEPVQDPECSGSNGSEATNGKLGDDANESNSGATAAVVHNSLSPEVDSPDPASPLEEGCIVNGKYVLERVLGRGSTGVVWLATDLQAEEAGDRESYVALKVLNENLKQHPDSIKALHREAKKARSLAHPNIVNVWSFGRTGSNYFITMEHLLGEPLEEVIKRHAGSGVGPVEAFEIIEKLAAGLSYAHARSIVHSDFKPANAMITRDGQIKILDFGVARAVNQMDETGRDRTLFDAATLGSITPAYASCELIYGAEPNVQNDVYALACVAYELLSGRHPFNKKSSATARKEGLTPAPIKGLTRRQNNAFRHALAFSEKDRTSSVTEFWAAMTQRKAARLYVYGGLLLSIVAIGMLAIWQPQPLNGFGQLAFASLFQQGPAADVEKSNATSQTGASGAVPPDAVQGNEVAVVSPDPIQKEQASESSEERLRQERLASQSADIRANFEQAIRQPSFDIEMAQQLLGELGVLSDLGAPLPNGEYLVVERLITQANALAERGKTEEAIDLVVLAQGLVLDSVELQNLESRLVVKNKAIKQKVSADQLLRAEEQVGFLLAAPKFGSGWESQLQQRFAELKNIGGADPKVAASARLIAEAYIEEAGRQRIEERDMNAAWSYLEEAKRYYPQASALKLEEVALNAAMASLRADAKTSPAKAPASASVVAYDICARASLVGAGALPGRFCHNALRDKSAGPIMVVVPAGGTLQAPLAVGKYEISIGSFNEYCRSDSTCTPIQASNKFYPATGITIGQAKAYINWLNKQSGQTYRLPTSPEWSYLAAATGTWPEENQNCQANSGAGSIKRQSAGPINAGGVVNAWGIYHYLGNVREWVLTSDKLEVRGGSYADENIDCRIQLSESHAGQADPYTGFRIVRKIGKSF